MKHAYRHVEIGCALLIIAIGTGATMAQQKDIKVDHIVNRPQLIVEEVAERNIEHAVAVLLTTLEYIETAEELSAKERSARIVETVGCAVYALHDASAEVMRSLSPQLRAERLSLVTAAAVISSHEFSQDIVGSLLEGRVAPLERQAIESAAAEPEKYLSRTELRLALRCVPALRPIPIRPQPIRPLEERAPSGAAASPSPAPRYDGQ